VRVYKPRAESWSVDFASGNITLITDNGHLGQIVYRIVIKVMKCSVCDDNEEVRIASCHRMLGETTTFRQGALTC